MTAPDALVAAVRAGERSALARVLTLVEGGGPDAEAVLRALPLDAGADEDAPAIVGITGAPGVGKSTLTDALVSRLRAHGASVAVLAVDPSSPFTGGAVLGDRVRMQRHERDPAVFIRSMATRGRHGGLARAAPQAIRVFAAAGFDWVLVETVGVGQAEVDIADTADTTVVVVSPAGGDRIQAIKAGVLEVGDVFVMNQADRPGADRARRDLEHAVTRGNGSGWTPPVVVTVATTGQGLDDLRGAILDHRRHLTASRQLGALRERRIANEVRGLVLDWALKRVDDVCSGERLATVVHDVTKGLSDPYTAATKLTDGADGHPPRRGES